MVQTLKRAYLSIELYCEKMLKPARLIGRETVQLDPFLNTANLYGGFSMETIVDLPKH